MLLPVGCSKPVVQRSGSDQQITFDRKAFWDSTQSTGADQEVYVAGTLTGEGVGFPNNSVSITCYKDRMECVTYQVWQIGQNQIGRLDVPSIYPVTRWDAFEIVATERPSPFGCSKTTISIERRSEIVLWVQEPVNQTSTLCKDADTRILKWTIEDSPWWKSFERPK